MYRHEPPPPCALATSAAVRRHARDVAPRPPDPADAVPDPWPHRKGLALPAAAAARHRPRPQPTTPPNDSTSRTASTTSRRPGRRQPALALARASSQIRANRALSRRKSPAAAVLAGTRASEALLRRRRGAGEGGEGRRRWWLGAARVAPGRRATRAWSLRCYNNKNGYFFKKNNDKNGFF